MDPHGTRKTVLHPWNTKKSRSFSGNTRRSGVTIMTLAMGATTDTLTECGSQTPLYHLRSRACGVFSGVIFVALAFGAAGCAATDAISGGAQAPSIRPFVRQTGQPPTQWVTFSMPKRGVVPFGITGGPHDDILVTERSGNYVDRVNPATRKIRRFLVPTAKAVLGPITLGPDGNRARVKFRVNSPA